MTAAVLDLLADVAGGIDAARTALADLHGPELVEVVRAAEELSRRAHALTVAATAAVSASGVAGELGFVTPALLLAAVSRLSMHEARTRVTHAELLGPRRALTGEPLDPELPVTAAAVAEGAIGPAHLRIIVDTLAQLPPSVGPEERAAAEQALVDAARRFDPKRLRAVADRVLAHLHPDGDRPDDHGPPAPSAGSLHVRRRRDGRYGLDGWLETVPGASLAAVLDALAAPRPLPDGTPDRRRADQRTADALVEACDLARSAQDCPTPGGAEPPHITVTLPLDALRDAADDAGDLLIPAQRTGETWWAVQRHDRPHQPCALCGDPLDADVTCRRTGAVLDHGTHLRAAEARLAACDAKVIPVVLGADSTPLDVGRATRTVPPPLRRAVVARDRGCSFPGCARPPARCHVHHVQHWADDGPNAVQNLVLLCPAHHRQVHALGWEIAIRGGTVWYTPPPVLDPARRPLRNELHCLVRQRC